MNITLYPEHLNILQARYEQALAETDFDQVVISAGSKVTVAEDDQTYPFRPMAFAQQWLPYDVDPDTFILFRPGNKPVLYWPARADFWHLTPQAPEGDWTTLWDVQASTGMPQWLGTLKGKTAWLGPDHSQLDQSAITLNPSTLKNALVYSRAWKTPFEISCLASANHKGVLGHRAAEQAFRQGQSEAGIYREFLAASQQLESQEPYSGIIALNESAATLHYERRLFKPPAEHRTLLIDAGAKVNGYASDITRTYTRDTGQFAEILQGVKTLSSQIIGNVVPGTNMATLHQQALVGIASLLKQHGICRLSVEEQLAKRIPQVFFPHGLGHLLGLQVHDVGGHQQDLKGDILASEKYPFLRLTRNLDTDMVITIEPGFYFIPMLLHKMEANLPGHGCDMNLIRELMPFGGVRIEDNVQVTFGQARNLTSQAFAS